MLNYIFGFFIIIGVLFSFFNNINLTDTFINSGLGTIDIIMHLIPIMCLWLGIMNIAIKSGFLDKITYLFKPILKIIFPDLKNEDKALSLISSNIVMNMLGLGNAATPLGLKAIKEMQELNKEKDTASRSMITFLVINTASVTIIPTTVIGLRLLHGSKDPSDILILTIITSFLSCLFGLFLDRLFYIIRRVK